MKKTLCITIMIACCIFALLLPVSSQDLSGSCGNGVNWSYDPQSATLTFTGESGIPRYSYTVTDRPWGSFADLVKIVKIESGITGIGTHAFSGMRSLHTVEMADSVERIDTYAFSGCISLRQIRWSEKLQTIHDYAFSGCESIETVSIPDGVRIIGLRAFAGCSSLKKVNFNKVRTIGGEAFSKCVSLTDIDFGQVRNVQGGAFSGCNGFTIVDNTGNIEVINSSAFYNNTSLRAIRFSPALKEIWEHSFEGCNSLKIIVFLGNAPKFMPVDAYYDSFALPDGAVAYYPANDATWTEDARELLGQKTLWVPVDDPFAVSLDVNPENFSGVCGPNTVFSLKDGVLTISGKGEVSHPSWNSYRSHIQKVVIQDGVTSIGAGAFQGCTNLSKLSIAQSVTSIGDSAFYNCDKLTQISLPSKLKIIGARAFGGCDGLTKLVIPNSVTTIGDGAFEHCRELQRIEIGTGVQSIGNRLFNGCIRLTEPVFLGNAPRYIAENAFVGCGGYIYIKNWNSWSYEDKFLHGGSLTWVVGTGGTSGKCGNNATWKVEGDVLIISGTGKTWDFNVNRLAPWMPYQQNIRKAVVEEGITELGDDAFYGMEMLEEAEFADSVTILGGDAFRGCSALRTVKLSENLKTIGEYAFLECQSLESIQLPDSVEVIEYGGFSGCNKLTQIVIPRHIKSIGQYAFLDCAGLKQIHFAGDAPSIHMVAFDELETTVTYPWLNTTWTNDVLKNYGGKITWQHRECKGEHTFWEWERISEPTTESTGLEKGVCSNCGFVEERVIPKLPEPSSGTTTTTTSPVTQPGIPDDDGKVTMQPRLFSDEAILVCGVIAAVFVVCSIVIFIRIAVLTQRAKKEKENEE